MGYGHYVYQLNPDLYTLASDSFRKEQFGTDCNLIGDICKESIDGSFYIGRNNVRLIDIQEPYGRDADDKGLFNNKFAQALENHPELQNRFYLVGEALNVLPHNRDVTSVFKGMNIPLIATCSRQDIRQGILDVGYISEGKKHYRSGKAGDDSFIYDAFLTTL